MNLWILCLDHLLKVVLLKKASFSDPVAYLNEGPINLEHATDRWHGQQEGKRNFYSSKVELCLFDADFSKGLSRFAFLYHVKDVKFERCFPVH
jgi:hypothetical protein